MFPHAAGYWAKKVRGKLVYFGCIAKDPKGAAGSICGWTKKTICRQAVCRARKSESLTVDGPGRPFLERQTPAGHFGELSKRTYDEASPRASLVKSFGLTRPVDNLRPADFNKLREQVAEMWGPVRLENEVQRV